MSEIRQQIELLLHEFEMKFSEIGVNDTSATVLLQLQLNDVRYLKHFGDLNNLTR